MTDKLTPSGVRALREAGEKASPRPWRIGLPNVVWLRYDDDEGRRVQRIITKCDAADGGNATNAEYIAEAANAAIPACDLIEDMARVVRAAKRRANSEPIATQQGWAFELQEAIRLFEKQHPEWLPETGAGKEITNMAKRLPWGHKSRHCIYCGKAGPRTMVVGGWAHKRCLFPPVLPRGEGIRRKVKTPPSGTSAGKEKGDA